MRLSLSEIFAGAVALWRANRDLLMRVAAVFLFLPLFAARLFIAMPDMGGDSVTTAQLVEILAAWYQANWLWVALAAVCQAFGIAVLLVLLLDASQPRLGQAMAQAAALLPLLILAWLLGFVLTTAGMFVLILPGLYLLGRTFITAAVLVGGPSRNPFNAVVASIALTRGHGWKLFLVQAVVGLLTSLLGGIFEGVEPVGAAMPLLGAVAALASAAITTLGSLAMVLLQISAYRGLSADREGI
jgi:hypothetical protein